MGSINARRVYRNEVSFTAGSEIWMYIEIQEGTMGIIYKASFPRVRSHSAEICDLQHKECTCSCLLVGNPSEKNYRIFASSVIPNNW